MINKIERVFTKDKIDRQHKEIQKHRNRIQKILLRVS